MMPSPEAVRRIAWLTQRIRSRAASLEEVEEFTSTLDRLEPTWRDGMLPALRKAGFGSFQEFARHILDERADHVVDLLVASGRGVMLAYAVTKSLAEA